MHFAAIAPILPFAVWSEVLIFFGDRMMTASSRPLAMGRLLSEQSLTGKTNSVLADFTDPVRGSATNGRHTRGGSGPGFDPRIHIEEDRVKTRR